MRGWCCSLRGVSLLCVLSWFAAPAGYALDVAIAPQPVAEALQLFARESGLQLVYVSEIAESRMSPGARKGLSDAQTLTRLLQRTGLRYEFINDRTVLISATARSQARPQPAGVRPAAESNVLEEVIVTAERRLADSQKTSISLSTIAGDLLARESRTDLRSALLPVPGLIVQGDVGRFNVAIRGIGTNTPPNAAETTVALNTDGIYNDMQINTAANYFDMDRVEVLRGPQGTLYGRNAAAGAVNLISNDPQQIFAASGSAAVGSYQLTQVDGVLNVPVSDSWATRLAVTSRSHDGYVSNGQNDQAARAARLKVLHTPTDELRLLLAASAERNEGSTGTVVAFAAQPVDPWIDNDSAPNASVTSAQLVYARLDWTTPVGTLTAIPAYQYRTTDNSFYSSGNRHNDTDNHLRQNSLELRITSPDAATVSWVAGVFGYDADGVIYFSNGTSAYSVSSSAAFGQLTIPVWEGWRAIAGLRLTFDRKRRARNQFNFQDDWRNLDFKLGAELDVAAQSLAYFTVASGYRPGGVYESPPGTFRVYQPEHLVSYELGTKNMFLENRLQLNADVFLYNYRDFQATGIRFINGVQVSGYQNAPGARVAGVEVESQWIPWQGHRLEASIAYLNAYFKNGFVNNGIDYSGSTLENAPRWSGTVRYERQWSVGGGTLSANAEVVSKSDYYLAYSRSLYSRQPAFSTVNLAVDYVFAADRWRLSGWLHNAGNYAVRTGYITTGTTGDFLAISPPRTYGAALSVQF